MRTFITFAAAVAISGCTLDDLGNATGIGPGRISPETVFAAQTPDELVALGAVRLTEEDIIDAVAGQTLIEPNEAWSWSINEDGTQFARADNGEWADAPGGQWQVVGNQFCRENEDLALKCSDVFQIGPYLRFSEPDGNLAVWTVTQSASQT